LSSAAAPATGSPATSCASKTALRVTHREHSRYAGKNRAAIIITEETDVKQVLVLLRLRRRCDALAHREIAGRAIVEF
jgi:hypothetical protein